MEKSHDLLFQLVEFLCALDGTKRGRSLQEAKNPLLNSCSAKCCFSDDLTADDFSEVSSLLPDDSQSELVDLANPYPITFPARKISVPAKFAPKMHGSEVTTGE